MKKIERFSNHSSKIQQTNITMISNAREVVEYYQWIVTLFSQYLGKRVLEVGAGIGTISEQLTRYVSELVISDIDEGCLKFIAKKKNLSLSCNIDYALYKLGEPCPEAFLINPFDSIVIVNVLEHIANDFEALVFLRNALKHQGHIILLVPALQSIYGKLDTALGHVRRYSKKQLVKICNNAGYTIMKIRYINLIGIFGWWFNGKLLKREVVPESNFKYFKYLFPLVKALESFHPLPLGISLLAIAHKN
ncbi:MAG: methyltransferase domain-containing protein [Candidatus Omnitrophica bacterium]|nr:methyltransferase domain-containing protein [Candidatus Omnitrophota bacterium]